MNVFCDEAGVQYEPGGESFNFAITMTRSRIHVRLITAMRRGGINRMLKQAIEIAGIEPWITWNESLPQGGHFLFSSNGKTDYAFSSTPIDRVSFESGILDRGFKDASLIYLDCNLGGKTLRELSKNAFGAGLPLILMSTDEQKTHRIFDVLPYADLVFLSMQEWEAFVSPPITAEIADSSYRTLFIRYSETGKLDVLRLSGEVVNTIPVPTDVPEI